MKKVYLAFYLLTIYTCSCIQQSPLEYALQQAGDNRIELEKVLRRYVGDSLKYQAACFLIENMPYHYYYSGEEVEFDKQYFRLLSETDLQPEIITDSLDKEKHRQKLNRPDIKFDIHEIDSAYLVKNIEHAFKVWHEQPWGNKISFKDFCEYILPYRLGDEPLMKWRDSLYRRYNPLLDSLRCKPESAYPWVAAETLLDSLKKRSIRFTSHPYARHSAGPQIAIWLAGNCRELTDAMTYICRAVGIPCGNDEMPIRGDNNVAHYWNFIPDNYCDAFYCSPLYPALLEQAHTYYTPKGKVYRQTFSLNREMVSELNESPENLHPFFRLPLFRDVTHLYTDSEQTIILSDSCFYEQPNRNELIYLCLSSWQSWVPVAWSRCVNKQVCFENVDGNVVCRLAVYRNNQLLPLTDPFWIHKELEYIRFFRSDGENEEITLFHKFHLFNEPFIERMVDGVFEASNDADFQHKDTLFIINEQPIRLHNTAVITPSRQYRYIRYYGPQNGYCNVSEIAFYETYEDSIPLCGKVIGTPGSNYPDLSHDYTRAFDGDPYTSFDYFLPSGGWTGLDLSKPVSIGKVVFTPRNRDNFIRKGDNYELFYDQQGVWISAGKQIANTDSLVYRIPQGSLLYLKNHTRGQDERIFEYWKGKQIFW